MTVLEARERVSGRVVTLHNFVPGRWVEGGGELIGGNHPNLTRLCKEVRARHARDVPVEIGGKLLTSEEA